MHFGALEILIFVIYLAAIIFIVMRVSRKNFRDSKKHLPSSEESGKSNREKKYES